jgi:Holliday junction resolvase
MALESQLQERFNRYLREQGYEVYEQPTSGKIPDAIAISEDKIVIIDQ